MQDIVGQMFDSDCVKELFRPQKVFTKKALRTVFERLAHASIMKLNSTAMDKVSLNSTQTHTLVVTILIPSPTQSHSQTYIFPYLWCR